MTPLKRNAETIDIAKGIAFLASSDAAFMTGALLVVDGALMYNRPANYMETWNVTTPQ